MPLYPCGKPATLRRTDMNRFITADIGENGENWSLLAWQVLTTNDEDYDPTDAELEEVVRALEDEHARSMGGV